VSSELEDKGSLQHMRAVRSSESLVDSGDHLVGLEEEAWGKREGERLGNLEVDDQLECRGLFYGQVRGVGLPAQLVQVVSSAPLQFRHARPTRHEAPSLHRHARGIHRWQPVLQCERCHVAAAMLERLGIREDEGRARASPRPARRGLHWYPRSQKKPKTTSLTPSSRVWCSRRASRRSPGDEGLFTGGCCMRVGGSRAFIRVSHVRQGMPQPAQCRLARVVGALLPCLLLAATVFLGGRALPVADASLLAASARAISTAADEASVRGETISWITLPAPSPRSAGAVPTTVG
jgi:hypothetical protein